MTLSGESIKLTQSILATARRCSPPRGNSRSSSQYQLLHKKIKNATRDLSIGSISPSRSLRDRSLPGGLTSHFVPDRIREFIQKRTGETLTTSISARGVTLKLHVTRYTDTWDDSEWNRTLMVIATALWILTESQTKGTKKTIEASVFLTPFKKHFPRGSLQAVSPDNVNSGVTTLEVGMPAEVVVFRQQEWIKVLIHELMHALRLGMTAVSERTVDSVVAKRYGIQDAGSDEVYIETWARIINAALTVYFMGEVEQDAFIEAMTRVMGLEALFAVKQSKSMLAGMGVSHESLTSDDTREHAASLYAEETSAFAYYHLVAALLSVQGTFISWCRENNPALFGFFNTPANATRFAELVDHSSNGSAFKRLCKCVRTGRGRKSRSPIPDRFSLVHTGRMTLMELRS